MDLSTQDFDWRCLRKGDVISVEDLEKITGQKRDTQKFQFAVLQLRLRIERDSAMAQTPLLTAQERGALKVMCDAEASEVLHSRFGNHLDAIGLTYKKMHRVDVKALGGEETRRHHDRMITQSRIHQAALAALETCPTEFKPQIQGGNGNAE